MSPLIEVILRDKDGEHRVAFEGTKSCVRMACTCSIGSTGHPCIHKLSALSQNADLGAFTAIGDIGSASSDYEIAYGWVFESKIASTIEDHQGQMQEYVVAEDELLGAEQELRKAQGESSQEGVASDDAWALHNLKRAKEEVAAAEKALRSARKKAQKSCARIVRVLNGISATGKPLEHGLSLEARTFAKWPDVTSEMLADFEERFFADEVVRARSELGGPQPPDSSQARS